MSPTGNIEIPPLLDQLLERLDSEGLQIEFKDAKGGLPKSLWETVSAFANTQGGWIILGVRERNDVAEVQGIANAHRMLQEFYDLLHNPTKINCAVSNENDATIADVDGKKLVVIRVPAVSRKVRPIFIGGNPYTGTFIRRHSGDYRCSHREVDLMIREASDEPPDSMILHNFGMEEIDPATLASYRRRFQTRQPRSARNGYDDRRFLLALGGYRRDRETGLAGLTIAGLLLMGTEDAIREWRKRHLIDYRTVTGEPSFGNRWDFRIAWEGNLLGAFDAIQSHLIANQPTAFRLQGDTRVDEGPVQIALREALVNLLVHADYQETDASLVVRSSEGFSFRNPGRSRIPESDMIAGNRSDPRNPTLVRMFRDIGLAEEAGTGMPQIIQAWRSLGLRMPSIEVGSERNEFSLHLRYAHLISEDDRVWLRSLSEDWSESEQLALVIARHDGDVDNPRLRKVANQHAADASRVLVSLRERGFLEKVRSGPRTCYELSSFSLKSIEDKRTDIQDSGVTIQDSTVGIQDSTLVEAAQRERELLAIAAPARSESRMSLTTRNTVIVRLCSHIPLAADEIARLMQRSESYIREALRDLLATKQIMFLYPERPRHPQQKYMTSDT
ncbi:MAG: putative DNA binding domain-containing protein, partial [Thermomicrobia bacterium]|nr:putative DNA binding domain-containing protein [Thermomicrobia bacterium]